MGDGTFHPEDRVTTAQLATMLDKLLGYSVQDVNYNWPNNAMNYARDRNLMNGISKGSTEYLNREEAAQMMFNALKATRVIKSNSSNYTSVRGNASAEFNSVNGSPNTEELIEKYFPSATYGYDSNNGSAVWKNGRTQIA